MTKYLRNLWHALTARSLENPSTSLSDPDEWLYDTLAGGERATSGVRVTHKTALTYSAFWRGVNLIAGYTAKLPMHLYRRVEPQGKELAREHPAYRLVRRKASPELKAFDFRLMMQGQVLSHGNSYAYIRRTGDGSPKELWPLSPIVTHPVRVNGKLWYVTTVDTKERRLRPEDVLHLRGLGFDGLMGYDVVTYARETLGLGLGMRKYGSVFFKNNAMPAMVLEHPASLSDDAKASLIKGWNRMHEGLDNQHRVAVLEEDMKAHVLSTDARRAQLAEMRQFEIREIANFLGVPPHKLGDPTRTAFASLEQENRSFLEDSLDVWLCQTEAEYDDKLLTDREKESGSHFFEFKREALLAVDLKTQVEAMVTEVNNGLLTPDEARAVRNRPPYPDGLGQKFRIPGNINTVGEEPAAEPDPPPPDADDDADDDDRAAALREMVVAHAQKMVRRVRAQAVKAAKRPEHYTDWIDDGLDACVRAPFEEGLVRLYRLCETGDHSPDLLVAVECDAFVEDMCARLWTAAEVQPAELVASVRQACVDAESDVAEKMRNMVENCDA